MNAILHNVKTMNTPHQPHENPPSDANSQEAKFKRHLLSDIPAEVRLIIYKLFFQNLEVQIAPKIHGGQELSLLHTCRLIRSEALPIFSSHAHAVVAHLDALDIQSSQQLPLVHSLRHVIIEEGPRGGILEQAQLEYLAQAFPRLERIDYFPSHPLNFSLLPEFLAHLLPVTFRDAELEPEYIPGVLNHSTLKRLLFTFMLGVRWSAPSVLILGRTLRYRGPLHVHCGIRMPTPDM